MVLDAKTTDLSFTGSDRNGKTASIKEQQKPEATWCELEINLQFMIAWSY